jgi:hypothetical protein
LAIFIAISPRLVARKQLGRRSSARLILEIDIRKLLPVVIADDKAGGLFLDGPRRQEAGASAILSPLSLRPTA